MVPEPTLQDKEAPAPARTIAAADSSQGGSQSVDKRRSAHVQS